MTVKQAPHADISEGEVSVALSDVLQALADPMRLRIVRLLAERGESPCGFLCEPISKSTVTHHLHVLRSAGLITQRQEGTRRLTRLDAGGMERRFPGLLDAVLGAARRVSESSAPRKLSI